MKIFPRPSLFYISPWLLAAAMALLVLIVVTFTLNNMQREQQLMRGAMLEKAETLMSIVHSGSRSANLADLRKGIWKADPWYEYVQRILDHVSENPEIRILAVVDDKGVILAHNRKELIGRKIESSLPSYSVAAESSSSAIAHRIFVDPAHGKIFEAVRPFLPYRSHAMGIPKNLLNRLHENVEMSMNVPRQQKNKESMDSGDFRTAYYILVGLDMSGYDNSLRQLKLQALVLSVVMLLVGIGGWFSLAAAHGYRVSQRTLRDIKGFTSLLMSKVPVGIIATDGSGAITSWNAAATEMTGVAKADAAGKLPASVLPGELSRFFWGSAGSGNDCPQAGQEKEVMFTIDGDKRYFLCHCVALGELEDEYRGEVLLVSDLTELKGLEKEMRENERLAAVGRMAAGVAHEVRNPLSSIKGLALLLKNRFSPESPERQTAGLLIQEVDRMNRTVSELLSFARPAALNIQRILLPELLDNTLRLIASDVLNNKIEIRKQVDPDLQPVAGDSDRLNQVFINLLLNAIQAMPDGGVLMLSARNSDRDASVLITIQDTGCGIPSENISQLFYPYFTTKPGGTGIGLAISQKILNDHKGNIRIESIAGKGTAAIVELPFFQDKTG